MHQAEISRLRDSFTRTTWIRRPFKGHWAYEWQILGLVIQIRHLGRARLFVWWDNDWLS